MERLRWRMLESQAPLEGVCDSTLRWALDLSMETRLRYMRGMAETCRVWSLPGKESRIMVGKETDENKNNNSIRGYACFQSVPRMEIEFKPRWTLYCDTCSSGTATEVKHVACGNCLTGGGSYCRYRCVSIDDEGSGKERGKQGTEGRSALAAWRFKVQAGRHLPLGILL